MKIAKILCAGIVGLAMALSTSIASAQVTSTAQTIALNATLTESLTVSLSANNVNFNLTAGSPTNAGLGTVTATTKWTLAAGRKDVFVYAYFASSTAALADTAGDNIPSSAFYIKDNGNAAAALTNTIAGFGGANAALQLEDVPITTANRASSQQDVMTFNIDLSTGTLPQLPANTYTGTLNIQAAAL